MNQSDLFEIITNHKDKGLPFVVYNEPYSEEIKLLANWIDDVWGRKYFQRLSVYNSRVKKAHKLVDKIGARIPDQMIWSNEALQFAKINNFLKVSNTQREQNNSEYIPLELAKQKSLFDNIILTPYILVNNRFT